MKNKLILVLLFTGFVMSVTIPTGIAFGQSTEQLNDKEIDVVWSTSDGERMEIFYTQRKDGIWSEPAQITDDYYDNMYPVIDRDSSGKRWVFWTAYYRGRMELRYSIGTGEEWQDSKTLTDEQMNNVAPSAVIDKDDSVWVVWSANDGDLDDIYVTVNENNTWSEPELVHDKNSVADMLPEIIINNSGSPEVNWQTLSDNKPTTLVSILEDDEWSEPFTQTETGEADDSEENEIVELPDFVNNSSMVYVRIY